MPASCLIWSMEPRAPEFAIIQMGLKSSASLRSSAVTASVVSFHTPTTAL